MICNINHDLGFIILKIRLEMIITVLHTVYHDIPLWKSWYYYLIMDKNYQKLTASTYDKIVLK